MVKERMSRADAGLTCMSALGLDPLVLLDEIMNELLEDCLRGELLLGELREGDIGML
eukprot:XP_001709501.1 Hypothetical protein GL50803_23127 [Giardia lamblia ATCC 50803]